MKFAQAYKYRHIPFCSQCAAHTKFIPVESNRVVGAVTYDTPNSNIDPTYVATRTETKLVCSTCGSTMFKWADVDMEQFNKSSNYFKKFYSQSQLKYEIGNQSNFPIGCFMLMMIGLLILGCLVGLSIFLLLSFWAPSLILNSSFSFTEVTFFFLSFWMIISTPYAWRFAKKENDAQIKNSIMAQQRQHRVITVGKGVNGETVLFDQKTGKIEYK
jgi:hypothetical protein